MIYTCYEMVRDCRADLPEGWAYFVSQYVPVIRRLLAHYGDPAQLEDILTRIRKPDSNLFASLEPAPERWFVAELRQAVTAELPMPRAELEIAIDQVATALAPLTLTEKQAVWLESMRYSHAESGAMLRMAPATVEKIRAKAAEMIRSSVDNWRRGLLAENGPALGRAAATAAGTDCLPVKTFLDILDGRTTWRARELMDQHVSSCWHCIDHFCRMVEVVELMRGIQPLTDAEAAPFRTLLGIEPAHRPGWKRMFGRA